MQTSNPRSRLVDVESTKGGWTHNVLFRQKKALLSPRIRNFCHYLHFSFTLDDEQYLETGRSYACEARTATRANPIAKPFAAPNQ